MTRTFGLIGVPSSAGAHWPGQERAPAALRAAGLIGRLEARGSRVVDHGDLPLVRMRPDPGHHPQNLGAVVDVADAVADRVEAALRAGETPLVLGGDCTIALGTLAGFLRQDEDLALLYFDGGVDLRTPADNPTGILDSMGVAHMIAEPGVADELARVGPRYPLMPDGRIVFFGPEPSPADVEQRTLRRRAMTVFPAEQVRHDPAATAAEALARVEGLAARFALHFDVDVIDFTDCPIADVPQHNAGLTLRAALACVRVFAASPRLAAITVTEFNPDHADEEGMVAATFAAGLAAALSGRPR